MTTANVDKLILLFKLARLGHVEFDGRAGVAGSEIF